MGKNTSHLQHHSGNDGKMLCIVVQVFVFDKAHACKTYRHGNSLACVPRWSPSSLPICSPSQCCSHLYESTPASAPFSPPTTSLTPVAATPSQCWPGESGLSSARRLRFFPPPSPAHQSACRAGSWRAVCNLPTNHSFSSSFTSTPASPESAGEQSLCPDWDLSVQQDYWCLLCSTVPSTDAVSSSLPRGPPVKL